MRVVVGRIGRAHGIKGEVGVEVRTDDPGTRFAPGSVLLPDGAGSSRVPPLVVEAARWHSGRLLVAFEGVHDRTAAEGLRGLLLEADVDADVRPDDPEEYYDRQLVGLAVALADGTPVGEVAEVVHLPGHDLLAVRGPDGREHLVPFVTEIVPLVDVDAGRIVIAPPPGLLDETADVDSAGSEAAEGAGPDDEG